MNFDVELKKKTEEIEKIIAQYLPVEEGFQKKVLEAMNYSVMAGGKRIRPMLMLETYRLFGGESEVVCPFMAAMEMIHTYSLVHDDLPAMDNDEYRRGRKTTHAQYGEAMGILAGDGLLNFAFETALQAFDVEPENPGIPKALKILAAKAGVYGMIGGQTVDIESTGQDIGKEKLDFIYRLKTGALVESAMMIGAVLAGADEAQVENIRSIAYDVGMAFQIQDDILDVTSTFEELGKPVYSDEKNDKVTYVTLKGIDRAKADVERLSARALKSFAAAQMKNEFLEELIKYLIDRKK